MAHKDALTWGKLKEMMKDADDNLPIVIVHKMGKDHYRFETALGAYISEAVEEGGALEIVNELPGE